jgi:hypothetical protein
MILIRFGQLLNTPFSFLLDAIFLWDGTIYSVQHIKIVFRSSLVSDSARKMVDDSQSDVSFVLHESIGVENEFYNVLLRKTL